LEINHREKKGKAMSIVIHGPRANRRVTCVTNPENAHSESDLAVNPLNAYNMVGSSKRFTDITNYVFSLAAHATFDGGQTWTETILPLTDTDGTTYPVTTDPAVAFDDKGNVYIVACAFYAFRTPGKIPASIGICIYQSTDGGRTWSTPVLIHSGAGDDKQAVWADTNPTSPYKGNVYAAWDNANNHHMLFARTTNHGASWKGITVGGVDKPAGTAIPNIFDSFSPEITVAADGTVIIVWVSYLTGDTINLVTSIDGGSTFSAPMTVASGITNLDNSGFPAIDKWPVFPGASFRILTFGTGSTSGTNLAVVWADGREGDSRIYYRHSPNLGSSWDGPASGQPLLTGALASPKGDQDFHPQIATTPTGEIGCVFYEYYTTYSEFSQSGAINVILAVSTDNGATFTNRVTVSDQAWNPFWDAPNADADPSVKFIGDYFGLAASSLGFFPFWTDTRHGFQDIFVARVSLYPADLYLRDGPGDKGDVPSPDKVFWESPDLVVRHQPDGDTNFVDQGLLRDGMTDHYVYGRATNLGPNDTPAATLAVTVGNYPSLLGAPGAEFWYPQDWYREDWNTAAVRNNHLYLGESAPLPISKGKKVILGPVLWPAAKIPREGTWHPCLLGEVRCGNDDSAGGVNGGDIPADPANTCPHGSFVYGNNNVCHRNLTYVPVPVKKHKAVRVEFPFTVGSVWDNKARFIEVTVDKGRDLASVPMSLRMETVTLPGTGGASDGDQGEPCPCEPGEIVFTGNCRVIVRVGKCEAGEIITTPGTVWRAYCPEGPKPVPAPTPPAGKGMEPSMSGTTWQLTEPRSTVGFSVAAREMRKLTLSLTSPNSLRRTATVRISERKDGKFVTGGVSIQLVPS
jgi:hypothetical protein